ncbi:ABC transporter substrate-binding protein [Treponema primitia]|uniref:ABC transporter substrate-binding protein n=1 Tax=Treponema primitia TaxID=88058 RepID=UPI00397FAAF4
MRRENLKLQKIIGLLLVLFILNAMGCKGSKSSAVASVNNSEQGQYETIEIRYQGTINEVRPFELAEDLGYLAPLKLKWIGNMISGPQDIQTTQTNETDVGIAFMSAVINLKAANGTLIGVIGATGSDRQRSSSLVVLDNSPIISGKDLIGKTIGVNTLAAASEVYIKNYLVKEGLVPEEIEKVELVIIPPVSMEQALRSKQIHGVQMSGLVKDKALESGGLRIIFSDVDLFGDNTNNVYVIRKSFADQNSNTVRKFVEATAKAVEWSKTTPIEEVRERMKSIIKKRDRDEDLNVTNYFKSYGLQSKGGLLYDRDLQVWIDWLVKQGDLKEGQIKPSDIYTNEFNPYNDQK